ncbi:hypothetical protein GCM10025879_03070 [Leuconostoc litchii]|uniref:Alkaline shock response membrane anchor protein AmaP n=1 Tax=Leuconostoc litchii TaxID=1981069 RepID=A0A6P2CPS0_9LACO|nr:alkaline shock response membrane anchor protein AmaP [Leuconostoc litchii]TYC47112.1 alkaline shock response membrane anchor protein AmaP [Leuconostoc litchii]GMA69061.1 hypothetical protein GCM10025879_03070 [Leuconostoc litchii]
MKKSKKILLIIFNLGYLVGISLLIWPDILSEVAGLLERFGVHVDFQSNIFVYYYGIVLLVLTALALLFVLVWPIQLPDVPLKQTKDGRLALSNYGISQFIKTQLSGKDLSNIKVTLKNTRRQRKFYIVADSVYKQATVEELPNISYNLTKSLNELLAGVNRLPIKVDIKVNQKSSSKRKVTRVI